MMLHSRMNDLVSLETAGQYKLFLTYVKCMRFVSRMNDQVFKVGHEIIGPCKLFPNYVICMWFLSRMNDMMFLEIDSCFFSCHMYVVFLQNE